AYLLLRLPIQSASCEVAHVESRACEPVPTHAVKDKQDMNKRRDILQLGMLTGAALLATPLFPRPARGQSAALAVTALNDKLLLIKGACNILARQADNGELLVVDGGLAEQADTLLELLEEHFGT